MLDALLIAGLVSAIATPITVLVIDYVKSINAAVTKPISSHAKLTLPAQNSRQAALVETGAKEYLTDSSEANCDDLGGGVLHEVPADVSEIVISGFRPGADNCRVWLQSPNVEFNHWTSAAGAVVAFQDADERLTIVFHGLKCLPFNDIETIVDRPDFGRQSVPLLNHDRGLDKNVFNEDLDDEAWRLAAWAETERAVDAFDYPAHAAENDDCGPRLPEFAGFEADSDFIEIWVPCANDADVRVDVLPTYDGNHGLITVAGRPTALLHGAPSASSRNIRIVPMRSKAA
ncbi:MAG: hypothetical protein ACR2OY_03075 [Boseongicola sp.]